MKDKYENLANTILNHIGGSNNLKNLTHCITRLRFQLKDDSLINLSLLEKTEGILSIIIRGEQYQLVIGSEISNVYKAVKSKI